MEGEGQKRKKKIGRKMKDVDFEKLCLTKIIFKILFK